MISFEVWLRKQEHRDDPTGDLAMDYIIACKNIRRENYVKFKGKKIPITYTFIEYPPCGNARRAYQAALEEWRLDDKN